MKNKIILALFLSIAIHGFSQNNKKTISGFIYDSTTKEVLIGASIYDVKNKIGATSNEYGFYSLTVPSADTILLSASSVGYTTKKLIIIPAPENKINILLTSGISLNEVVITETKQENKIRNAETGVITMQMKDVKLLPNLFGEVDIIQALHLTPGVQSGGEGKSNTITYYKSVQNNMV